MDTQTSVCLGDVPEKKDWTKNPYISNNISC